MLRLYEPRFTFGSSPEESAPAVVASGSCSSGAGRSVCSTPLQGTFEAAFVQEAGIEEVEDSSWLVTEDS